MSITEDLIPLKGSKSEIGMELQIRCKYPEYYGLLYRTSVLERELPGYVPTAAEIFYHTQLIERFPKTSCCKCCCKICSS